MNSAKEKAQELVDKYYQLVADGSYPEYHAKQCALIAVDEVLNNIELINNRHQINYWREVKQEIEKYKQLNNVR